MTATLPSQTPADAAAADAALKAKHRALWASGDYAAVAAEVIPSLGAALVRRTGITAGTRVLDVAAGSGNASIPAALAGASVTASDLTPELFDAGRIAARAAGVELAWVEADAEHLPFATGEFDAAISCVGVMFAPHHQQAADELLRVVRPGGRIGVLSWTPTGFIGEMFAAMKPFAPPPPGASPAPLWGDEAHVRALFGDRVTGVEAHREHLDVTRFRDAVSFREYFKACYGPTIAVYKANAEHPDRIAALDAALVELASRHLATSVGPGMQWEYLTVTATRA
ncbi:class I SAM-dependent methyltransferase [Sporichthya polymorpha]|uniref:class I SAM-dependent methyltransferase n=1 Tax=Sporichthya polymorpha TaxID=35751 RepID=UPI00035FB2CD|nr:class I SAM-dependent methyltransferase [Sporichthya polymorpha]